MLYILCNMGLFWSLDHCLFTILSASFSQYSLSLLLSFIYTVQLLFLLCRNVVYACFLMRMVLSSGFTFATIISIVPAWTSGCKFNLVKGIAHDSRITKVQVLNSSHIQTGVLLPGDPSKEQAAVLFLAIKKAVLLKFEWALLRSVNMLMLIWILL